MIKRTINISKSDILKAHKKYIKWTNNMDEEIPSSITNEIKNLIFVIDAYDSQLKKMGKKSIFERGMNEWITYCLCSFFALKFRKALIKMWDKEYPEHVEECFETAKKILLVIFEYHFDEELALQKTYSTEVYYDFTK